MNSLRNWAFLLFVLAGGLLSVRLGFWQLSRLEERRARNAEILARLDMPVLQVTGEEPPEAVLYRRVRLVGTFDEEESVVLVSRAYKDRPGVHLVTPLRLESGVGVLVDRGWIPQEESSPQGRTRYRTNGTVEVLGIALPSQRQPWLGWLADPTAAPEGHRDAWRALTVDRIAPQVPYPLAPYYVAQSEPLTGTAGPIPDPDLDLSEGPHLSYAVQWFSFAAIGLLGGIYWYLRQMRG